MGKRILVGVFVLAAVLLTAGSFHHQQPYPIFRYQSSNLMLSQHPIEALIHRSRQQHVARINGQSKSLESAVIVYRTRYGIDPPPGFDKWFEFAQLKRSPIIDDYDTINDVLLPFLNISGQRINDMLEEAVATRSGVHKCGYRNGAHFGNCGHRDMSWYMAPIEYLIPNVEFAINDLDEPRVLLDLEFDSRAKPVNFLDWSHKDVRQLYWAQCPTIDWREYSVGPDLPFVLDAKQARDLCQHPAYADQHGFVLSPSSLWLTGQAVPLLSPAKASVFQDLVYPNPAYAEDYFDPRVYDEDKDPDWRHKLNDLYWSGESYGGYFQDDSWDHSHRQRFVALTNNLVNSTSTFLGESSPGVWNTSQSLDPLPGLFNVHFTSIDSATCETAKCSEQQKFFGMRGNKRVSNNDQFQHRFVMDLDAWTYSRQFYTHLQSKSLPFKQTIFQEWHDDRLMPWVHYVPVSLSLKELPEMIRYFALTKSGQTYAQEIAEEGRDWWAKALRKEDMQIYMYRLILEYKRLRDPERPPMS